MNKNGPESHQEPRYPQLTYTAVRETALRIALENPEFKYEKPPARDAGCKYTESGNPGCLHLGCLFGRALLELGVEREFLLEIDNGDPIGITEVLKRLDVRETPEEHIDNVSHLLDTAQVSQDQGEPWARAAEILQGDCGCVDDNYYELPI